MPRLLGKNIMLREYQAEDLSFMRAWVNDANITDNLSDLFLQPHSQKDTERYLNSILNHEYSDQIHFVIAEKESAKYLGQVDIIHIDWKNRFAEFGIVIPAESNQNKGIGSEAIHLLQDYVFRKLNLNRLQLNLHEYNLRAYNCYKKCGFIEEGRLRKHFFTNGQYWDTISMSILKDEYLKLRSND